MALDLSGAVTAPPRSQKAAAKVSAAKSGKLAERHEAVTGFWQLAGFGCIILKQYADAGAIGLHSPAITDELVALSDKNEKIARAIDYLSEAGPYAGLIVATMPLVMQVLANHNIVKAELVSGGGVVPPAALESQVRADMARTAAQALKAQQTAEQELAALADQMRQGGPEDGSQGIPEANGQGHAPQTRPRGRAKTE